MAIVDEAHRLRRRTTLYPYLSSNRPQAEENMEHVQILVAFLDERQRLRKAEEGTVDYFRECAMNVGVPAQNIYGPLELHAQFRYAVNHNFTKALDMALYDSVAVGFSHQNFEVRVTDSVEEMERYLQNEIELGYSARLVAGFCWPWSDPNTDGSLVPDVNIEGWSRAWNRKVDQNRSYAATEHPYALWAKRITDQLGEVGCIYSVQGFEFDYVGVIWGSDLVWRDGQWIA